MDQGEIYPHMLTFYHNERPVKIPACQNFLCPLPLFLEFIADNNVKSNEEESSTSFIEKVETL